MNPTLQQCRQYYECIPREMRDRPMPQYLLAAIQIAEAYQEMLAIDDVKRAQDKLARVTKPEGE